MTAWVQVEGVRKGWVKLRDRGKVLYGRWFLLRLKRVVFKSCVMSTIMYGSEMKILQWTERSMVRAMCGKQKKSWGMDVDVLIEWNNGSAGYGKQCSLAWSCAEERGWSCLEIGIRFWCWRSKKEREAEEEKKEAGWGRMVGEGEIYFAEQSGVLA